MSAAPRRRRARGHPIRCDCSLFSCALRPPAVRAPQPAARSGRPERTYGSHRSLEEREATALGLYCVRGGRFCGADRPQVSRGWECVEELRHSFPHPSPPEGPCRRASPGYRRRREPQTNLAARLSVPPTGSKGVRAQQSEGRAASRTPRTLQRGYTLSEPLCPRTFHQVRVITHQHLRRPPSISASCAAGGHRQPSRRAGPSLSRRRRRRRWTHGRRQGHKKRLQHCGKWKKRRKARPPRAHTPSHTP
jgi:hypothetical protein